MARTKVIAWAGYEVDEETETETDTSPNKAALAHRSGIASDTAINEGRNM